MGLEGVKMAERKLTRAGQLAGSKGSANGSHCSPAARDWWCRDLKLSFLRLSLSAVDEKGRDALG